MPSPSSSPSPFHPTPWVRRLVAVNAAVYVLAVTVFFGRWFEQAVAFTPAGAAAHPWTFVTYMFVHGGLLHLAVTMLILLMFGPGVERRMGGAAFLRYYILCGLGGPVAALGMSLFTPDVAPFVGASAAVFGVALAFALYWPRACVFVFPLPWPVSVKMLVAVLAAMSLVPLVFGAHGGAAHLAHLGGFVLGYAYLKGSDLVERRTPVTVTPEQETPVLVAHQSSAASGDEPTEPTRRSDARNEIAREMDRVLDKISRQGLSSLTAAERRFLDEMSRQMRQE